MNISPNQDIKAQFSQRLKYALEQHALTASPTLLRNAFNERYTGKPISIQTASNWLSGVALPSQDKLQVLANWLSVDSHWLRFGESTPTPNLSELSADQIEVVMGFAMLTPTHQKIITELIASLLPQNKTSSKKPTQPIE